MGRAPCCEKMGLKKGPWTPEEDQVLVAYIHRFGHSNWRALPKHAGLLRCGKSCRLRWTNYLRPDIKRGNFTREEEETIINLHELLGNRWSAIAARLPGRTDNEIKNVWHTHLKKRLKQTHTTQLDYNSNSTNSSITTTTDPDCQFLYAKKGSNVSRISKINSFIIEPQQYSPITSTTDLSFSGTDSSTDTLENHTTGTNCDDPNADIDEKWWSEVLSTDQEAGMELNKIEEQYGHPYGPHSDDKNMDFWLNLYVKAGELTELPEF